jgi:hypothetical protein
MSDGEHMKIADQASNAAGWAFRAGEYVKASRLLAVARTADPSRSPLWAKRTSRVHTAAREQAAKVAGPNDARPLPEIVTARLEAAGIRANDHALAFARAWNAERTAAAADQAEPELEPEPDGQARAEAQPDLLAEAEPEAAQ